MTSANKLNELQCVGLDEVEVLLKSLRDAIKDALISMSSLKHGKVSWEDWIDSIELSKVTSLCEDIVSAGENLVTLNDDDPTELSDL